MKSCKAILLGSMACAAFKNIQEHLTVACNLNCIENPDIASNMLKEFRDCDVIVGGPINEAIAESINDLKLFHVFRGGIGGLGIELLPPDVMVAHTFHHGPGIAEFVIMSMLMLPRRVQFHDKCLRRGDWSESKKLWGDSPDHDALLGKKVVIVGAGHIGQHIGIRLKGFGVERIGITRNPQKKREGFDVLKNYTELPRHIPEADFLIVACRLAEETIGLIGKEELYAMKPTAYVINVAQGTIVDEKALFEVLSNKKIAGAAIDSWYHHPEHKKDICFPSTYPFHTLFNVLLSPNRCSWTSNMLEARAKDVAENINNLVLGKQLKNIVEVPLT